MTNHQKCLILDFQALFVSLIFSSISIFENIFAHIVLLKWDICSDF